MATGLRFNSAADVFKAFPTVSEDILTPPADVSPLDYLRGLGASATPEEAITFCAYLLPRREAVWWACQCIMAFPALQGPNDGPLLELTERWVRDPDEETRTACMEAASKVQPMTPAGWAAMAVAWTGNMTANAEFPMQAPDHLTAKAVNVAILGTLAGVPASERSQTLSAFLDGGIMLATRKEA
ncbi:hypothetical protein HDIA_2333 [Hartmannibacter diazotrophicus]|uniref:Uncharacterized protein n=1 Tax=Hartmannibacter diazotrophicus TaxID=1482074 RepID=A0A2C9D6C7_9HYPH|nr:hypothetical protein [Hartmannibacter diazotrophicus]SON55874.1 hypothetical protein HDIA_2333 [Hartmannibacter diazotrophicus]